MSKEKGKFTPSEQLCKHSPGQISFLEGKVTPHIQYPDTHSVYQAIFLCKSCSQIVTKNCVISRDYDADGNIPKEMWDAMEKIKADQEARIKAEMAAREKMKAEEAAKTEETKTTEKVVVSDTVKEPEATA